MKFSGINIPSLKNQDPGTFLLISGPCVIETIGEAVVAVGADVIFIETHPNPAHAKCDGLNMLRLNQMDKLPGILVALRKTVDSFSN